MKSRICCRLGSPGAGDLRGIATQVAVRGHRGKPATTASVDAMSLGQILGRAHLLQSADRSLKLECARAGRVQLRRFSIGRRQQLDLMLVQLVDQGYEPG